MYCSRHSFRPRLVVHYNGSNGRKTHQKRILFQDRTQILCQKYHVYILFSVGHWAYGTVHGNIFDHSERVDEYSACHVGVINALSSRGGGWEPPTDPNQLVTISPTVNCSLFDRRIDNSVIPHLWIQNLCPILCK